MFNSYVKLLEGYQSSKTNETYEKSFFKWLGSKVQGNHGNWGYQSNNQSIYGFAQNSEGFQQQ